MSAAGSQRVPAGTDDVDALFPGQSFISTILDTLGTKQRMSSWMRRRYIQRAAMAGVIIGILYATSYGVIANFGKIPVGDVTLDPLGRIAGALTFGWALVFIYYTKSELLTSNMMIVSIGWYYKSIGWIKALRLMGFCFLGNFLGGVFIALMFRFSSIVDGPIMAEMEHSVDTKLAYITDGASGWVDLLIRAILCNFMINLAMLVVYNGLIKQDIMKGLAMIVSVFIFFFLGLEHSVANTVLFTIVGLEHGIAIGPALGNVGLALVGNFIGGGILIGVYYAYVNDKARFLRQGQSAAR